MGMGSLGRPPLDGQAGPLATGKSQLWALKSLSSGPIQLPFNHSNEVLTNPIPVLLEHLRYSRIGIIT